MSAALTTAQPQYAKPAEAAAALGVSTTTLAVWASAGRLTAIRTAKGHRRYDWGSVLRLRDRGGTRPPEPPPLLEDPLLD